MRASKGRPLYGPPWGEEPPTEAKLARRPARLFPERLDLVLDLVRDLAPSLFPLWLALPPRARDREGRAVWRRPSPPPMKGQGSPPPWRMRERGAEDEERRRWESAGFRAPLPLFIKERGGGSAAPLSESRHGKGRESGPTRSRRPSFPLHRPLPQTHGGRVAGVQN